MSEQTVRSGQHSYPCSSCGANVEFAPGTDVLRCPYCGAETALPTVSRQVREHDWAQFAGLPRKPVASVGAYVFSCKNCGATTESNAISDRCQFCGASVVAETSGGEMVEPEAVLPFAVDRAGVRTALQSWTASRWFAPSELKKVTAAESIQSTYLPHWTYDSKTVSDYQGQRGDHYYETEYYTETVDGQQVTRSREVQRTAWSPASGRVARDFDDVLIRGTNHVSAKHLDELEPWPLPEARPYQPDYLAGHQTLRYDVEPEEGLGHAKERMATIIEQDCRQDIGGDEQRVDWVNTNHHDVTFKLMLLPVWIACYLYAGNRYNVLVNGRTAEVAGERPYSKAKIAAAIAAALVALALIITAFVVFKRH